MNELIVIVLGIAALFLAVCSVALLALGKMIDAYPTENEDTRERSIASPVESTKIAIIIFWALFLPGAWAVFQTSRITLIAGITLLFSACLFMITAIIFSVAVMSTLRRRRNAIGEIERQADIDTALIHLEKVTGVRAVSHPEVPRSYKKPVRGSSPWMTQFFRNF